MRYLFLGLISLLVAGCGYRFDNTCPEDLPTITVPYVEGDLNGELTAAIIKEIACSGYYTYRTFGGEYVLSIEIIDTYDDNIGYRYDRKKNGELTKEIIPVETRIEMIVEVTLRDVCGQIVKGPVRIKANIDYDHNWYKVRNGVNIFSLGQLTDIESAEDAALAPLNRRMAKKIVDYIYHGW